MFTKKVSLGLIILCFLGLMAKVPESWGATLKIGYIDITEAFEGYHKTQKSEKEFQAEKKKKQEEIKKREEKIKSLSAELEKKKRILKKEEVAKRNEEIKKRTAELREFMIKANVELREENARLIKELSADIEEAIKNFAKSRRYSIILRKESDLRISPLLFAPKSMDLTEEFIKFLNKKK
ncbi:MAG: OmpH family outer membrane protein [Candidatus Omnitrophica bacterium]|nr:OmpH family outer membrane protein [Candidatus Omnitrophota bacterium]